jgi:hypothetical protein
MSKNFITQSDIEKHNRAVEKMIRQSFAKFNPDHPDLLKDAPKGYFFTITNKLAKKIEVSSKVFKVKRLH